MRPLRSSLLALLVLVLTTGCAQAQYEADARWLAENLELTERSVIADIGAGEGELTIALSDHIGPDGRIYSTELGEDSVEDLRAAIADAELTNTPVTIRPGRSDRTNLPEGCCDALVMRRVYHHIDEPGPWNENLYRTLKPGGRLAIIDFLPWGGTEAKDPENRDQGDTHGINVETVATELERAGFTILSSEVRDDEDIYVLAEKPGAE